MREKVTKLAIDSECKVVTAKKGGCNSVDIAYHEQWLYEVV